jgi:hypothetical protein
MPDAAGWPVTASEVAKSLRSASEFYEEHARPECLSDMLLTAVSIATNYLEHLPPDLIPEGMEVWGIRNHEGKPWKWGGNGPEGTDR